MCTCGMEFRRRVAGEVDVFRGLGGGWGFTNVLDGDGT